MVAQRKSASIFIKRNHTSNHKLLILLCSWLISILDLSIKSQENIKYDFFGTTMMKKWRRAGDNAERYLGKVPVVTLAQTTFRDAAYRALISYSKIILWRSEVIGMRHQSNAHIVSKIKYLSPRTAPTGEKYHEISIYRTYDRNRENISVLLIIS